MMQPAQTWLVLALLLPWLAVPLAAGIRHARWRNSLVLAIAAFTALAVCMLAAAHQGGEGASFTLLSWLPGVPLRFEADALGLLFALVASILWVATHGYSIGYMHENNEKNQPRFFACMAASIGCAMGLALSANLATSFIFYELMTLCTFPLVSHSGTDEARRSGRLYLATLMGASLILLLPAMLVIWQLAGSLDYRPGGLLAGAQHLPWLGLLLFACIYGTAKAAFMPLHRWLPAAMVAPAPVSALLHAVAVVKAGVFLIAKIMLFIFGAKTLSAYAGLYPIGYGWLPLAAGVTVVLAGVAALRQDSLKLRLAYSTVGQLSYIILALSVLGGWAIIGAVAHIAAHALGKITLFFAAGNIATIAGKHKVSQLDGIGRRMPWTMGAFALASLSIIGLPPMLGFVSKWWMLRGMLQAGDWFAFAVLALGSLLTSGYLLPIIYRAFFCAASEDETPLSEVPWAMRLPVLATAALCLLLFFLSPGLFAMLAPLQGEGI
jgi:multicomponent Na+:H+ antiporter subunit D